MMSFTTWMELKISILNESARQRKTVLKSLSSVEPVVKPGERVLAIYNSPNLETT